MIRPASRDNNVQKGIFAQSVELINSKINTQNFTQTPPRYPPTPVDRKNRGIRGQGSELLFIQQRNKIRNGTLLESVGLDLWLGEIIGISQISVMGGNSGGW